MLGGAAPMFRCSGEGEERKKPVLLFRRTGRNGDWQRAAAFPVRALLRRKSLRAIALAEFGSVSFLRRSSLYASERDRERLHPTNLWLIGARIRRSLLSHNPPPLFLITPAARPLHRVHAGPQIMVGLSASSRTTFAIGSASAAALAPKLAQTNTSVVDRPSRS